MNNECDDHKLHLKGNKFPNKSFDDKFYLTLQFDETFFMRNIWKMFLKKEGEKCSFNVFFIGSI